MSVPKPGRASANATRYKSEQARWNKRQQKNSFCNDFRGNQKGGKTADVINRDRSKPQ